MQRSKAKSQNNCFREIHFLLVFVGLGLIFSHFSLAAQSNSQQQDLKRKIEALRTQIEQYQKEIYAKASQEKTLQDEIAVLEKDIAKIELQIQETELVIQSLSLEIADKENQIEAMQKEIETQKAILSHFIQELYEREQMSSVELALGNETFADYFFETDSLEAFQERTREVYERFVYLREGLKKERQELFARKEEQLDLRAIENDQRRTLDLQRTTKELLLKQTRNEKQALQAQMEKLQAELDVLQSLGVPIKIEEAISAARYASKLTGVAPEFLLGVLRVESGLGSNVGGGRYKTDMNPAQWDAFKKICTELGFDPGEMPVSRRVCYNAEAEDGCGGWGGAMGPAQFMPSTWLAYKSKVEKLTGKNPANPWDLKDSLVAMGLKLAAVEGVTAGDREAWAKAAGMYLAGDNWENYSWYSDRVLFYADGFKKIMK